jgi:hypothetical protein
VGHGYPRPTGAVGPNVEIGPERTFDGQSELSLTGDFGKLIVC